MCLVVKKIRQTAGWSEIHEEYFLCDVMPYSLVVIYNFFSGQPINSVFKMKEKIVFCALNMVAVLSSESCYHITRRHIPEDMAVTRVLSFTAEPHLSGRRVSGSPNKQIAK